MNKKALTADKTLLYLLIAAVVFLILAFFVMKVYDYMMSKGDIESCRISVFTADKVWQLGQSVELKCPKKNVLLSEDSYTVNGDKKKYREEEYAKSVLRVFANEMTECWDKMGKGELSLPFTTGCVLCSHLQFENPPEKAAGDLYAYLQETKMPVVATQFEDISYYDYLYKEIDEFFPIKDQEQGIKTNIWIYADEKLNSGSLTTNQEYDIFYYKFTKPTSSAKVVSVSGAEEEMYAIGVYPSTALSETCSYIYE